MDKLNLNECFYKNNYSQCEDNHIPRIKFTLPDSYIELYLKQLLKAILIYDTS